MVFWNWRGNNAYKYNGRIEVSKRNFFKKKRFCWEKAMKYMASYAAPLFPVRSDAIYNLAAQSHVQVSFDVSKYSGDVRGKWNPQELAQREAAVRK